MKPNKYFIILICCLICIPQVIQAQKSRLEKANLLYEYTSYAEAIPKYEKLWKRDSTNNEVLTKLADCYRKINDVQKAVLFYGKIIERGIAQPIDKLYYGQLLMTTGKHQEAKKYLAQYTADQRGITFINAMQHIEKFYKDSADYTVTKMPFNSKQNDFSPRIYGKKIVFASSRQRAYAENHINTWTNHSFFKLFYTQKKKNGKYKHPRPFRHSLDNRFNSGPASFSKQERVIYLTRNNIVDGKPIRAKDGQVKLHIYAASINKCATGYQYLLDFIYNNSEYNTMHPAISDDGNRLYFVSDMPGTKGGMDIWMCSRENGSWSQPKNLTAINTEGDEAFPFVNGRILYFSSNGREGLGGFDIYKIALDEKGIPGGNIYNMGYPINSPADDFGIVVNENGMEGFFSSNRNSLNFNDDIFSLKLKDKNKRDILISGTVVDYYSGETMNDAQVKLLDNENQTIEEVKVNENGNFVFLALPNQEYTVKGTKEDYLENQKKVATAVDEKTNIVKTNLELEKDPKLTLHIVVTDSKTNIPMSGVSIELIDNITGKKYQFETTSTGDYNHRLTDKNVGDKLNYTVKLKRKGYFNKSADFQYNISNKGTIDMRYAMDKIMEVEPIYFDYNKFNIRPDAAEKLDALAEMLMENPTWYIELYSFTDCRGTEEYNNELSEKRALATAQYLIDKGVSKGRIVSKGMGIKRLVVQCDCKKPGESNCTEDQHQLNRRTEFIIKY